MIITGGMAFGLVAICCILLGVFFEMSLLFSSFFLQMAVHSETPLGLVIIPT